MSSGKHSNIAINSCSHVRRDGRVWFITCKYAINIFSATNQPRREADLLNLGVNAVYVIFVLEKRKIKASLLSLPL